MNEDKLLKIVETSARLETLCNLLEGPTLQVPDVPYKYRKIWIKHYNDIVDKVNKYSGRKVHSHWIDWDYNPPESYEDKMLDYWDPVS